jgi:Domain of unknown function (DUF4276)
VLPRIASIVEGDGEVEALPIVIRRILSESDPALVSDLRRPIRLPRSKLLKPGELEKAVELAARTIGGAGAVLVVLDSEGEPPCQLGPMLLKRAQQARRDLPVGVVLAHREWEAWYLAAMRSLAGRRGLRADSASPLDPESTQGAKEWLRKNMSEGRTYSPAVDQPAFAGVFDLVSARRAPSFAKLCREVLRLFHEAQMRW